MNTATPHKASTTGSETITYELGYAIRGVAMLMIIFVHSINEYPAFDTNWSRALMIPEYGVIGCSLFFFMSGYGLSKSLTRVAVPDWAYLFRHLKKLLLPFVAAFFATSFIICTWPANITGSPANDLSALLTLSMPDGTDMWFFKVILANYLVTILLAMCEVSATKRIAVLLCLHTSFVCICYTTHVPGYWYFSNLSFVSGAAYPLLGRSARQKSISRLLLAIAAIIYYISICMHHPKAPIEIIGNLALCISVVPIAKRLPACIIQYPGLQFIGKNSLYFYLFNVAVMMAIPSQEMNFFVYFLMNVLLTTLAVLLWKLTTKAL